MLVGLAAWLLGWGPLPTLIAAALGAAAGWWVIGVYDRLIVRANAAAVGALVGAGIAALLVLALQASLSPSALLVLALGPAIIAAELVLRYRDLMVTEAAEAARGQVLPCFNGKRKCLTP